MRTAVAYLAIQADAAFSVRVVGLLKNLGDLGSIIPHVMAPWWSTYLHEARPLLLDRLPALWTQLSDEATATFERSRHGVKMFLDTKRDIVAYEEYFAEIEAAHRREFPVRHWSTRGTAPDLGLISYDGALVATSHGGAFGIGLEPESIHDAKLGERLRELWSEAGGAFAMAALAIEGPRPVATLGWKPELLTDRDVDAARYYPEIFTGEVHPHLNAVLLHYLGMVNSAHKLLPMAFDLEADRYVLFKIRYLLTTHVAGSLKKLLEEHRTLPEASGLWLHYLVDRMPAPAVMEGPWLRNLLVHYLPNRSSDLSRFDPDNLLESIVRISEREESVASLIGQTDANLRHLVDGLNGWMSGRRFDADA